MDNGYEDTSFIAGMTDKELCSIGVRSKAHRSALLDAIKALPEPEIDPAVPVSVASSCLSLPSSCSLLAHVKF